MPSAIYGAFFFTVAWLVTTGYFLMGGLPLLILKHDVPMDAKFIRGFFNVYYRAAFWTALGACLSYALWGRLSFALGAAGVAAIVTVLRRRLVPAMEQLGALMEQRDADAVERFRRIHITALLVNLALLVGIVWGIIRLAGQLA